MAGKGRAISSLGSAGSCCANEVAAPLRGAQCSVASLSMCGSAEPTHRPFACANFDADTSGIRVEIAAIANIAASFRRVPCAFEREAGRLVASQTSLPFALSLAAIAACDEDGGPPLVGPALISCSDSHKEFDAASSLETPSSRRPASTTAACTDSHKGLEAPSPPATRATEGWPAAPALGSSLEEPIAVPVPAVPALLTTSS